MMLSLRFSSVRVQPAYGSGGALVTWTMRDPRDLRGNFYLYRSADGMNWTDEPINERNPVTGVGEYVDKVAFPNQLDEQLFYRVLWQSADSDDEDESGPVSVWEDMTRMDFGILRATMNLELKSLRDARGGVKYYVLRPKTRGKRCPACYDPTTGTSSQAGVCTTCYGTTFEGGYSSPSVTWARDTAPGQFATMATGSDNLTTKNKSLHALAYPMLLPHDVLVNPRTDDRWVVDDNGSRVQSYLDRFPLFLDVTVGLALRGSILYRVPVVPPEFTNHE